MRFFDRFLGRIAFTAWDLKEGGQRLKEYRALDRMQYWDKEKVNKLQEKRLNDLLTHAWKTSPWYRQQFEQAGFLPTGSQVVSDLTALPVTRKSDIRNNTDQFISSDYHKERLNRAKTGGSTGVSLNLYFDDRCQQWRNAAQMYADGFSNWKPGHRVAAVWGNPSQAVTMKQRIRRYLLERVIYLDTMDLNPVSMEQFVQDWRAFQPDVIFGHAHSIFLFASYLCEQGITDLKPRGIVATSMMLLENERSVIEQAFGARVTNRYGCEEVGLIAVECEQHNGMHINSPHIVLEALDEDDKPVPYGQPGKLVVTDLNNYGMPLIRYKIEDVGVLSNRECSCGRIFPVLERIEGRVADFLKKPDGGQVAGVSLVERTLTKVPGIEQMQLIQESLDEIIINRVKGNEYNEYTDSSLVKEFREVFDENVKLTIRDVSKIPQEASGKYRFSICRI